AYRLDLPQELSRVHNVFHICNLKKCLSNDTLVIPLEEIQLDDKLNFVKEPIEIMAHEVKQLKRSPIPIIKVCWNARRGLEYTWEREDQFMEKYPHPFKNPRSTTTSACVEANDTTKVVVKLPVCDRKQRRRKENAAAAVDLTPHTERPRIQEWSLLSSSDFSPVHSSGLDASDQAHSGSSTRDVSPILCYPSRRAPRRSKAFHHWCATPLSTLYPPTTSESSSGDSSERPLHSSSHSAGPSRKRCRSLVDSVPSSTLVMGSLAPTRADLLPPCNRFRDSYSSEPSIEEDTEIDPIETGVDMELGISDGDDVKYHVEIDPRDVRDDTKEYKANTSAGDTVEVGIDPMSAPIFAEEIVEPAREDSSDLSGTRDGIVRSFEDMPIDLNDVVRDFYHHMFEVRIDRIIEIETAQRRLEADQLIAKGQRVSMIERIDRLRLEHLKVHAMLDIERDHVNRLRRLESYVKRRLGFRP
ncbi:hypothetical protein Tco_0947944, partial [Tanacetum coccineum]